MIILCQFRPNWNLLNASPFCMKTELFLKINAIPHKIDDSMQAMEQAPVRKMPYIIDNGKKIADSEFIQEYLTEKYNIKPDDHLSESEKSIAYAFTKMLEEHLYWVLVYSRWVDNWSIIKKEFFGNEEKVSFFVKQKMLEQLNGQGIGLHSRDKIYHIGCKIIDHLSNFLGKKKFMMGNKLTNLDITFYSFMSNIADVPIESPLKERVLQHDNIMNYMNRFKLEYLNKN